MTKHEPAPLADGQREAVLEQARRYHEVVAIFNSSQPQALYNHNASRAALNGFAFCVASGSPALYAPPPLPTAANGGAPVSTYGGGAGGNGVRRPRGGRGVGVSRSRDASPGVGSRASRSSDRAGSREPSPAGGRRSRDPSPSGGRRSADRPPSPGMRGPIQRRLPGSSVERSSVDRSSVERSSVDRSSIERHLPGPSVERKLPGFNKARTEEQLQRKAGGYRGHAEADVTTCLLLYKLISHYLEKVTVYRGQRQLVLDSQEDR